MMIQQISLGLALILGINLFIGCSDKKTIHPTNNSSKKTNGPPVFVQSKIIPAEFKPFLDQLSVDNSKTNREVINGEKNWITFNNENILTDVNLSRYPEVAGDLDLRSFKSLQGVAFYGTNIKQVKISKQSELGKQLWYYNHSLDNEELIDLTDEQKQALVAEAADQIIPAGDQLLTKLMHTRVSKEKLPKGYIFQKQDEGFVTIILVD